MRDRVPNTHQHATTELFVRGDVQPATPSRAKHSDVWGAWGSGRGCHKDAQPFFFFLTKAATL